MKTTRAFYVGMVAAGIAVFLAGGQARLSAQPATDPAVRIGAKDGQLTFQRKPGKATEK